MQQRRRRQRRHNAAMLEENKVCCPSMNLCYVSISLPLARKSSLARNVVDRMAPGTRSPCQVPDRAEAYRVACLSMRCGLNIIPVSCQTL